MRCPCQVSGAQIYWFFSSVENAKNHVSWNINRKGCGEFRSALKVQRGKCCATSFLDLHEILLRRSVLQLLERCAQQENVPEFFLKGHGRQSYVPLTCQA